MCALATAKSNVDAEDNFSSQEEGKTSAESLMQIREVQIASSHGHFPCIIEEQETNGANNSAVVFCLHEK